MKFSLYEQSFLCLKIGKASFLFLLIAFFPSDKLADDRHAGSETSSTISSEVDVNGVELEEVIQVKGHHKPEVTLLDLYSGCGAMSTGLCLGAKLSGLNLVTVSAVFFVI